MICKYLIFSLFSLCSFIPNDLRFSNKTTIKKIYGKDLKNELIKEKDLPNNFYKENNKAKEKEIVDFNNYNVDNSSFYDSKLKEKLSNLKKKNNFVNKSIINNKFRTSNQSRKFYKDVYSSYSHYYERQGIRSSYYQTSSFDLLKWSDYASSWNEFKKYYGNFNFDYYGKVIAVNNWKPVDSNYYSSSTSWGLNSIESGTGWQSIISYSKNVKYGFWYKTKTLKGIIYYKVYKSSNYIKGQFDFTYDGDTDLSASSQYVNFEASIKNVKIKNTYDYSHIKKSLNNLNNQNVWIDDDRPNAISYKNKNKFDTKLNQIIKNNLGSKYYDWWKSDFNYEYYYSSKEVYLKVNFNDINTNSKIEWKFKLNLRVDFSQNVKNLLNNKVNNKTISLDYDYPTNISNNQNRSKFSEKITNLLKSVLGWTRYQDWKDYIKDYEYDFIYNKAKINIKFNHPDSNNPIVWSFNLYLKIDFNQWVKSELDKSLNNKTFFIDFDYPTSISNSKNKSNFSNQINNLLKDKLKDKYQFWKSYIKDYDYDFYHNKVKIYFKFNDPNSNQSRIWIFEAKLKINLNNFTKLELDKKLNGSVLEYNSDYSSSILDPNNLSQSDDLITNKIKSILGDKNYILWKKYIQKYSYDNDTNQASIVIRFNNPNDNKIVLWNFRVRLKINLTKVYWNKYWKEFHTNKKESLKSRLKITPGKVVDPNNPNGDLIDDKPIIWNDKNIYSTTAFLRFDALKENNEEMKINGTLIDVLDYQFTFQMMADNNVNKEFEIELSGVDKKEKNTKYNYKTSYVIRQFIPPLFLKWYAWDPNKPENYKQKDLVTPFLENNKPNPKYDKEINVNTGTKTQIVWIKNQAPNAFALDPLDINGNLIENNKFDKGYLVEASVSHKGVLESFEDPWIKKVERISLDLKDFGILDNWKEIKRNKEVYFSESGSYLYRIIDQKNNYAFKVVVIGHNDKDNNYLKFLDLVNNQNLAIDFWATIQGYHLKSFLAKYKTIDEIDNLSYEQILGYWKEYVSGIKTRYISLDIHNHNFLDLANLKIDDLKINENFLIEIRQKIINHINNQLKKYELKNNSDYQILGLNNDNLSNLLAFDEQRKARLKITIVAINSSLKARNSLSLAILNSKDYDVKKVFDLSWIKFKNQNYNFSKFSVDKLKKWINDFINKNLKNIYYEYKNYKFELDKDYQINWINDNELEKFIKNNGYELKIQIKSVFNSLKVIGRTYLELLNDFNQPHFEKIIDDKDNKDKDFEIINPDNKNKDDKVPDGKNKNGDDLDKNKNNILDLNSINFKRQIANFSKFAIDDLKKLLKDEIVKKLKEYYNNYQIFKLELNEDYEIVFPSDDEILTFIKTNGLELKIIINGINKGKVDGETYLELLNDFIQPNFEKIIDDKDDVNDLEKNKDKFTKKPNGNDDKDKEIVEKKDPDGKDKETNSIFDLNNIKFKRQVANFSKFAIDDLKKLLKDEIVKKLKEYYNNYQIFKLELNEDYEITFPSDDEILTFIKTNGSEIKTTIQAINKDKVDGETYLELLNDFSKPNFEKIIDDKDKEIVDKKDPANKDKETKKWIEKPSSQILISFIVLGIIMTVVIGFILKNRFSKGIGGRRIKRNKQNKNIKIEGVN